MSLQAKEIDAPALANLKAITACATLNFENNNSRVAAAYALGAIQQAEATIDQRFFDERLRELIDELALLLITGPDNKEDAAYLNYLFDRVEEEILLRTMMP